jgi:hypothetical protein
MYIPSLIEALQIENDKERSFIYLSLVKTREISAYKFVVDIYRQNLDPVNAEWIESAALSERSLFKPPLGIGINVLLDSLISSLAQSASFGWVGDANFVNELDANLRSARSHLLSGDSLDCAKEVQKFQDKVRREHKEGTSPDDNRFATVEGYRFLYYNSQYVIERLIALPTWWMVLRVLPPLQQLDSLKLEVQRQQSKKNLGGLLLVKGLNLFVDQAKKQLQQGDSTKVAITIKLFQIVVDETNELTDALLEKNRPLPPVYVKDEAYVQLHYRAKYILEGLPEPRIDIGQQRQQLMDKELQKELDALKRKVEGEQ